MADIPALIFGNICAGKSTLARSIKEYREMVEELLGMPLTVYLESLDRVWRGNFYRDREKHTDPFEASCLNRRHARYQEAKDIEGAAVFDRGMIEGAEIFCLNSYQEGYLSKRNYDKYITNLYDILDELGRRKEVVGSWLERLIVYLKVEDCSILEKRNKERAEKEGVEIVPVEYLERLNGLYERYVENIKEIYEGKYAVPVPKVITIDASVDMREDSGFFLSNVKEMVAEMRKVMDK